MGWLHGAGAPRLYDGQLAIPQPLPKPGELHHAVLVRGDRLHPEALPPVRDCHAVRALVIHWLEAVRSPTYWWGFPLRS